MKKRTTKKLSKSIGAKIDDASGSGSSEPWWSTNPEFVSLEGEIRGNYGPVHDWGTDSTGEALLSSGPLAGRPDLQDWAKDRRLVYEALLATSFKL